MKTTQILKYIETTEADYFFETEVILFGLVKIQLEKKHVIISSGVELKPGVLYFVDGCKDDKEFSFLLHPPYTVLSEVNKDTTTQFETTLSLIK